MSIGAGPISVVHVINTLDNGGACRCALELARSSAQLGGVSHSVVVLRSADPGVARHATEAGIDVAVRPADIHNRLARADIVVVEYYNHPLVVRFLTGDLPPMRLIIQCHIGGDGPPNVITEGLVELADVLLATSSYSAGLKVLSGAGDRVAYIHSPTTRELARDLLRLPLRRGDGKTIGYLGTVDFVKMHRQFAAMHCAIADPDARVLVCGGSAYGDTDARDIVRSEAAAFGRRHMFDFRDRVDDITVAFGEMDIFGYPLCTGTHASAELVLQEAMFSGLPPVVFGDNAAGAMVDHGRTGYVVHDEREYAEAMDHLLSSPDVRGRLGAAAREHARVAFDSDRAGRSLNDLCVRLMARPKRARRWTEASYDRVPEGSGAAAFLAALGEFGVPYRQALSADPHIARSGVEAVRALADHPLMRSPGFGSASHYLRYHPGDQILAYWAKLSAEANHGGVPDSQSR